MSENKNWQIATLVKSELASVNVKKLVFKINPSTVLGASKAGQHYDIKLTAPNGYVAERSYSVASPPEQTDEIEFGVQLFENGEVSPYLWQMKPATAGKSGDQVEIRGPIGGHFTWCHTMPGPLVLIGGGSGVVPLISMIRHWQKNLDDRKVILLASFRSLEHVLYRAELEKLESENQNFKFTKVLTNHEARIDSEKLKNVLGEVLAKMPMIYICGPTKFVEAMSNYLVTLGTNPHLIKTERFG
ncbi:MAG: FAD-binding oxidoreductase [Patescibacteria group bacterium]